MNLPHRAVLRFLRFESSPSARHERRHRGSHPRGNQHPREVLFTRDGKPVLYIATHGHYQAKEVKVLARNPDEIAVSSIVPGATVALVDPEKKDSKNAPVKWPAGHSSPAIS